MFTVIRHRLRALPRRHPILWQTLQWSLPALAFGLLLRVLLLSYSPYAYWGSDSRSYFGFTSGVLNEFYFSLNDKRRLLYPIFLLPITLLPGPALVWLALVQGALGLVSVLPIAYAVRRVFTRWRFWIIPTTLIYTGLPVFLWYEHELLAECLFFCALAWSIGGWVAFVLATPGPRKAVLWWWFFIPFAIALLTKPAGRFLLPGVLLGLLLVKVWRHLRWRAVIAAGAVLGLAATMGDDDQGAWLLYTSAFPFTQLHTPLHADYKREIVDLVEFSRADLMRFADRESQVFLFLRNPRKQEERPLWKALGEDRERRSEVYTNLALEAIAAEPIGFLSLSLNRILASANPEEFELDRFEADYFGARFSEAHGSGRNSHAMLHLAFAYPRASPMPPIDWFRRRISPNPNSRAAVWLMTYAYTYERAARLFAFVDPENEDTTTTLRPTAFGWFVLGSALAAIIFSFPTLGLWLVIAGGYLVGVFLVGVQHPRYFAAVWPMVIVILPALPDAVLRLLGCAARQWRGVAKTRLPSSAGGP